MSKKNTKKQPSVPETPPDIAPDKRVSVSGLTFPKSGAEDWAYYQGAGYVHNAELEWFLSCHIESMVSGKFIHRDSSVQCLMGFISKEEFKNGYALCAHCKLAVPKDEMVEAVLANGTKAKISIYYAKETGDYFLDEETKSYTHCSLGVEIYYKSEENWKVKHVCKSSLKLGDKHERCDDCSHNYMAEYVANRSEFDNIHVCEKCYDKRIRSGAIAPYNDKHYPAPVYTKTVNRITPENQKMIDEYMKKAGMGPEGMQRLYGVEAEVEMHKTSVAKAGLDRWKLANMVKKTLGVDFVNIKEDGTLLMNGKYSDNSNTNRYAGFEIVSAPADLATHRARWPLIEKESFHKHLRAWDTDTCGLHIHVSRASLTPMIIGRILVFVNHPKNKKFIQTMAGRSEEKFTKYYDKKISDAIHPERVINQESDTEYNQKRRVAVNLSNAATIEFRIFRGTIRSCHIIRDLEFVDAIIKFCYPCERPWRQMGSYQAFIDFAASHRKEWPELCRWLYLHNLPSSHLIPRNAPFGKKDTRGQKAPEVIEHAPVGVAPNPSAPSLVEQIEQAIAAAPATKKKKPIVVADDDDSDTF